jgi:hypothetical protein
MMTSFAQRFDNGSQERNALMKVGHESRTLIDLLRINQIRLTAEWFRIGGLDREPSDRFGCFHNRKVSPDTTG